MSGIIHHPSYRQTERQTDKGLVPPLFNAALQYSSSDTLAGGKLVERGRHLTQQLDAAKTTTLSGYQRRHRGDTPFVGH